MNSAKRDEYRTLAHLCVTLGASYAELDRIVIQNGILPVLRLDDVAYFSAAAAERIKRIWTLRQVPARNPR